MTLVKNILRSSISSIAYLRYLFPEDNFTDTLLAGLKIKSLVPNSNQEVAAMGNWMEKGVFDAIEKHYLKALVFSIFAEFNNPQSLLESYTFKFTYPSDGNISMGMFADVKGKATKELSYMTREQIQQAWCTMIRTLITLSHTLPPLPQERHIAMRLYYYDDITPPDYNPPGFTQADDAPSFEFIADPECVEIGGSVKTKYHTVSLKLDTAMPNYQSENHQEDIFDEIIERTILAISELEENKFNKENLIQKVGIEEDKLDGILEKLLAIDFIEEEENQTFKKILTKVNQDRIENIAAKYNVLEGRN